ncbi:MAG: hypothetical protein ISP01_05480 [Methanobrevibacter arboriphilus]|uniref:Uncharacterized protein n=1 Tax=Methanobrevibacter arboriphilus TaxID=39441 RepID=A0A843APZ0_METAZ|nr:hypothetical protein [Methanobrevibacter arboriphilus]MBF4468840.1 hypothetical protein [Methanobrevibacter arboriphilus]
MEHRLGTVFLGNLSVQQIEKRLGIEISENERLKLKNMHCNNATDIPENKWHCFDMPFVLMCGSKETCQIVYDILKKYSSKMEEEIRIEYEVKKEDS